MPDQILTDRFERAFVYACHIHAAQKRKNTAIPYISHPMAVASLVLEDGGDEDEAIAALLHDAVEDQGGENRLHDIRGRFGDRVAEIVHGCTDALDRSKHDRAERKKHYIAHLRTASSSVLRVAAADKLHNARSILKDHRAIGDEVFTRFNQPKDQTLFYYEELAKALGEARPGYLSQELKRVVKKLGKRTSRNGSSSARTT